MRTLLRAALIASGMAAVHQPAAAVQQSADTVHYEVSFPNAVHREAEVSVTYRNLPAGPLELRMSRSSPGRYALHEFGKNVYNVRATNSAGRDLTVTRPNPHQWDVSGHDGTVKVSYTIFGDHPDGTYVGFDLTHAHMNMPATFMWARGTETRPIRLTLDLLSGWRVATQLRETSSPGVFTAPHLQYFMDSPTEASAFDLREWDVTSGGRTQTIRLAVHHLGTAQQMDAFTEMVKKVVVAQADVFGELPEFDFGEYTFIADYLPWARGDGMEHRNSTILTSTGSLANPLGVLGTVSHEFFHAWNVERIRPAALEPFDFEEANMSGELWFAEGFTSYYGPLTIRRAGITSDSAYAASLTGTLNAIINGTGRDYFSPVEMSMQAPFVDAAASVDAQNRSNTFISYYTWGAGIGLALDLAIRSRFDGKSLDDFMRTMWRRHGVQQANYTPLRPYTIDDLRTALAETVGDSAFANDFFRRYIHGREAPDYATLLARAGLLVRPAASTTPTIGTAAYEARGDSVFVTSRVPVQSPLYSAGVDLGDRIISLDGRPVTAVADIQRAVSAKQTGATIDIVFEHRNIRRNARMTVEGNSAVSVQRYEDAGMTPTAAMLRFRADWLDR